ncbi:hypothetical protein TrRE_jg9601 [Triparma retinervis]|uniref:Uncharacterized protein n=1 Tax=Triparma retinervis TaxID=2557542 RepID=A0A9W7E7G0_9STRA|nr:hypothetical protein TrRE_jg9601 [Triparma retinervis]
MERRHENMNERGNRVRANTGPSATGRQPGAALSPPPGLSGAVAVPPNGRGGGYEEKKAKQREKEAREVEERIEGIRHREQLLREEVERRRREEEERLKNEEERERKKMKGTEQSKAVSRKEEARVLEKRDSGKLQDKNKRQQQSQQKQKQKTKKKGGGPKDKRRRLTSQGSQDDDDEAAAEADWGDGGGGLNVTSWFIFRFLRRCFGGVLYRAAMYSRDLVYISTYLNGSAARMCMEEPWLGACLAFPFVFQVVVGLGVEWMGMPHWGPVVLCFVMDLNEMELMAVSCVLGTVKKGLTFHPLMMMGIGVYLLIVAVTAGVIQSGFSQAFFVYAAGITWMNGVKVIDWIDTGKRG